MRGLNYLRQKSLPWNIQVAFDTSRIDVISKQFYLNPVGGSMPMDIKRLGVTMATGFTSPYCSNVHIVHSFLL